MKTDLADAYFVGRAYSNGLFEAYTERRTTRTFLPRPWRGFRRVRTAEWRWFGVKKGWNDDRLIEGPWVPNLIRANRDAHDWLEFKSETRNRRWERSSM